MAWRGESWAELVERAASGTRRMRETQQEDPSALAARATSWTLPARARAVEDGLCIGAALESIEIAFAQLYHVEPVDPWPSLALGWVDRGESSKTVLAPLEHEEEAFARSVEEVVAACEERVPSMTFRGWLDVAMARWERVEKLPDEGAEAPVLRGYRMAPRAPDPIVAMRTNDVPEAGLWTWIWARQQIARRIQPKKVVLTHAFVYVRTRNGQTLRLPADTLRTSRVTADGDTVYVLGRNTELLLVKKRECPLAETLDARVAALRPR